MKRVTLFAILLLICVGVVGSYGQDVIPVAAGTNQITAAFAQAEAGDIIELTTSGGTYFEDSLVTATVPITIRAANGLAEKPIWECGDGHILDIGSSVWLSGIRMTGFVDDGIVDDRDSTKYAMRSADVVDSGYVLICDDMEFDHFGRVDDGVLQGYVYRADAPAKYAEEIRFTNCMFTRVPSYGFRFREPTVSPGQFGVLSFENCTFAGIGDYGIRAALISDTGVPDAQIRVNHCTFYDIGNDVIRADDGGANDFTDIVVKNSIFYNTGQIVDASHGTVTYCSEMNTNGFNIDDENAVIENIYSEDPEFTDAENFDFTVSDFFAGIALGDDGFVVGDLRWYKLDLVQIAAGDNRIAAAFAQVNPGGVIELTTNGGTYYEDDKVTASFPITIRAAAGLAEKPIWESGGDHILDIGSDVHLAGIKISGFVDDGVEDDRDSTKYAMRSADVVDSGYVLICNEMEFDHFGRFDDGVLQGYVYRADAPAEYAEEIRFTNCMFTRIPSYGFRFREPTVSPGQFGVLSFQNCTFAGIGDYGIRAALLSDPEVPDAQIRVNHCTFYDVGNDVIRADDGGANDFTDIEVKNSIFYQTGQIVDASHGTVTYCSELNTNGFNIDDENAIIENIYSEDPEFADAANFDFTVSEFFAGIAVGDDGFVVGDLRWYKLDMVQIVAGDNRIAAAFAQVNPGGVIELTTSGGTYYEEFKAVARFPITIRAAAELAEKPIWECGGDHVLDIGSDVHLSGIRMTGFTDDGMEDDRDSTKYAMRSADVVDFGYTLICDDMEFDLFGRFDDDVLQGYVYRADATAEYAQEIRFTNCMFTRIPSYGFRFREPTVSPGQFGVLSFENCTFAEIGDYGIRADLLSDPGVPDAQIRVNQCTFYDIGNDVIRADDDGDNDYTDIVVKNSIFFETGQIVDASHGTVTYCSELNTNGFKIDDENAVIENIYVEDPEFTDAENFDFTVSEFFVGIAVGDEGQCIGDTRWCPTMGEMGDVDGNGTINVLDVMAVVLHILDTVPLSGDALARADCNNDGVVNILDAVAIIRIILGEIASCDEAGSCAQVTPGVEAFLKSSVRPHLSVEQYTELMALVKSGGIPIEFGLSQNYPNPFNPITSIAYSLPENGKVRLNVYNVLGQEVDVLVDGQMEAGYYTVKWDASNMASGIYFYRIESGSHTMTRQMVLLK